MDDTTDSSVSPEDPLGSQGHQPHSLHGLHRGRPAQTASSSASSTRATGATWASRRRLRSPATSSAPWSASARSSWCATPRAPSAWSRTSAPTAACSSAVSAHGNRKAEGFTCPYHQWSYTLQGDLQGVPFRRGVQAGRQGQRRHARRLQARRPRPQQAQGRQRAAAWCSPRFDADVESLEDFLGPDILRLLRPPVQRPQADASSATTASAFRATGS